MRHIAVIGAGHAGCEAALSAARLGARVTMFALSLDSVANMPCNPCIGGSAKGHLVREIDALGGEMGKAIDATFIQSRMLNTSKGPAVYSLRAQADKKKYMQYMKQKLENEKYITLFEEEVVEIAAHDGKLVAIITESGQTLRCCAAVVASGTYLKSRCLYGETIKHTGPGGLRNSSKLSLSLEKLGFKLRRFKTGTPARIHRRSINFDKMAVQNGDKKILPFSFETDPYAIETPNTPCHLTYTTTTTHDIIAKNVHKSAMYSGAIEATGTRYCPSIEDKIVRFADKERHQIFIEPEGLSTNEMYVQGMSSALPLDVQQLVYQSVIGLENCEIMRPAYAIEYDVIDSSKLYLSLEAKDIRGLYFAGQICGSSGYEEAAAQGLIAGINAAGKMLEIGRNEGYIGVLIDDLVTKGTNEPYRMMTSRAEYRLLLRQDNADQRLTPKGYELGLISKQRYLKFSEKRNAIQELKSYLENTTLNPKKANKILCTGGSKEIISGAKISELIKRPEMSINDFKALIPINLCHLSDYVKEAVYEQASIVIKYSGYIDLQISQAEQFVKMEEKPIPKGIVYNNIKGLRIEAQQKLTIIQPKNFGQASRITGVSPADISVLLVYIKSVEK